MMTANALGLLVGLVWGALGLGAAMLLMKWTSFGAKGPNTNFDVRANFKFLALPLLAGFAVVGWVAGPILFGDR